MGVIWKCNEMLDMVETAGEAGVGADAGDFDGAGDGEGA